MANWYGPARGPKVWRGSGFTLIELLVVVAIIALLMAILLPSLGGARQQAQKLKCLSSLRQIQMASNTYANEWNEYYMPVRVTASTGLHSWVRHPLLREYMGISRVFDSTRAAAPRAFICPNASLSLSKPVMTGQDVYGLNLVYGANVTDLTTAQLLSDFVGWRRLTVSRPGSVMAYSDAIDYWTMYSNSNLYVGEVESTITMAAAYRHNDGANVVYFDGHGEYQPRSKLDINYGLSANKAIWMPQMP